MIVNGLEVPGFMRRGAAQQSKMDYIKLQSRTTSSFPPPHRTQLPPRYHSSLTGGPSYPNSWRASWQRRVWGIIAILVSALVAFYFFSLVRGIQRLRTAGYAIVIDAGSTGSRLHVFHYRAGDYVPYIDTKDSVSLKSKPGLSAFSSNPQKAGESLVELLSFANGKVPEKERRHSRLFLMATAGLRRLDKNIQEEILESCRVVLRDSQFLFKDSWASVISGVDEGMFAWVSANYALGTLGRDPHDTTGIFELGGASAQVTFVPDSPPPPEFLHPLELAGVKYNLYTYSFLHFGQEAAWESLFQMLLTGEVKPALRVEAGVVVDPCTPSGYVMSSELLTRYTSSFLGSKHSKVSTVLSAGNFTECRKAALELLEKGHDQCLHERCAIGSTFIPEIRGKIFATENFFYTSEFFGLPATTSLVEMESAGRFYCGEQWKKLQEKHEGIEEEDLLKYCFSTAYIVALLHDRLGIEMNDDRVRFTNKVGNVPLDWALGALIVKLEKSSFSSSSSSSSSSGGMMMMMGDHDVVTVVLVLGGLGILCVIIWIIVRCRKPRVKTIYDLEKGRYITRTTHR